MAQPNDMQLLQDLEKRADEVDRRVTALEKQRGKGERR